MDGSLALVALWHKTSAKIERWNMAKTGRHNQNLQNLVNNATIFAKCEKGICQI
jgi:hypothetical protein